MSRLNQPPPSDPKRTYAGGQPSEVSQKAVVPFQPVTPTRIRRETHTPREEVERAIESRVTAAPNTREHAQQLMAVLHDLGGENRPIGTRLAVSSVISDRKHLSSLQGDREIGAMLRRDLTSLTDKIFLDVSRASAFDEKVTYLSECSDEDFSRLRLWALPTEAELSLAMVDRAGLSKRMEGYLEVLERLRPQPRIGDSWSHPCSDYYNALTPLLFEPAARHLWTTPAGQELTERIVDRACLDYELDPGSKLVGSVVVSDFFFHAELLRGNDLLMERIRAGDALPWRTLTRKWGSSFRFEPVQAVEPFRQGLSAAFEPLADFFTNDRLWTDQAKVLDQLIRNDSDEQRSAGYMLQTVQAMFDHGTKPVRQLLHYALLNASIREFLVCEFVTRSIECTWAFGPYPARTVQRTPEKFGIGFAAAAKLAHDRETFGLIPHLFENDYSPAERAEMANWIAGHADSAVRTKLLEKARDDLREVRALMRREGPILAVDLLPSADGYRDIA